MKEFLEKLPFYNSMVLPVHWVQAVVAGVKYGWPGKGLRVIGVTGTNGKTTTCFMIWKMLNEVGHKTGLMTTVAWGGVPKMKGMRAEGDWLEKQVEHMTTVDSFTLNKRIRAIKEAGAEFLVLEVTSHAMAQFRTLGVPVEIAVMTNVTHEHLDYHKTFERYVRAKCKLFRKAEFGIINADDPSCGKFIEGVLSRRLFLGPLRAAWPSLRPFERALRTTPSKNYSSYGIKKGDLRAKEVKLGVSGVKYACGDIKIETQIPGEFNVYNSLAAVAVGQKLGLSGRQISDGIRALKEVEGRMNRVDAGQDFEVIVDYAHTPDAIEKVYDSVAGHEGRIIAVHGGAGRRDESTRGPRGEILGKKSDIVVITEDDSRDEDPEKIAAAFVKGCEKAGKVVDKDLFIELDREKAIGKAIGLAKKGDLVLVLGKGHEKTILRADGAHPFEDLKVVRKVLAQKVVGA